MCVISITQKQINRNSKFGLTLDYEQNGRLTYLLEDSEDPGLDVGLRSERNCFDREHRAELLHFLLLGGVELGITLKSK